MAYSRFQQSRRRRTALRPRPSCGGEPLCQGFVCAGVSIIWQWLRAERLADSSAYNDARGAFQWLQLGQREPVSRLLVIVKLTGKRA